MFSSKHVISFARTRPSFVSRIRHPTTTNKQTRFRGNHPTAGSRRFLSSDDKRHPDLSLEECARSLSQLSNPQSPAASLETAMELARKMSPGARHEIVQVLRAGRESEKVVTAAASAEGASISEIPNPSYKDLRLVALGQAIPFLGFGLMDNMILIIAGDAIDTSLGMKPIYDKNVSIVCATCI